VCVDRYPGVRGMVAFHNYVGTAPLQHWYDDNVNLVAFSRGSLGFFTTNNASTAKTITVQTGPPGGTYCDLIHGSQSAGHCSGPSVHVAANGQATMTVSVKDSIAFTRKDRVA
jgi:alpha-amylase